MKAMFFRNSAFNGDLSKWNLDAAVSMTRMFEESVFDRTICGDKWASLNAFEHIHVKPNGRSGCCNGGSYMSNPHATPFVVTDGGGSCSKCNGLINLVNNSDVACPDIHDMVRDWLKDETKAIVKYGHIEDWNTSLVTDMSHLFCGITGCGEKNKGTLVQSFDSDLSKWNVAAVTTMYRTFRSASAFNGNLSTWNVAAVTSMYRTFYKASVFNGDLSKWNVAAVTNMYYSTYNSTSFLVFFCLFNSITL